MSNIYDSANALSRGLRELPEYKAVKEARDAIQADAEANKIFEDYIAFQQEIQMMAQTGQMPDASFQGKMDSISKQIEGNELVSSFFNKQQQLSIYLSDIERIVFEPISELLK
ncbi:YlbF/YmcA family competence regulator [Streptococcus mitis]|uniref:YlbF/YmcA family competence regulator n=1 Tax=Streptococcus mitis TaxID=28037 RepID=UPI00115AB497|nr:YlbF/YmcA family competence regulator [Streptococcus mitis]